MKEKNTKEERMEKKIVGSVPIHDEIVEAIQGSIKKWRDIRDGKGVDEGGDNCPLCQAFSVCYECPIFWKTGKMKCAGTPYVTWRSILGDCDGCGVEDAPKEKWGEAYQAAVDLIDFLYDLLIEWQEKGKEKK